MKTSIIGYPRVGSLRELKFTTEKYFRGESQGTEPMSPVLLPETAVPPADSTAELPRNPHFLPSNSARPIQRDFQTRSN